MREQLRKMARILGVEIEEATHSDPSGEVSHGYLLKFEDVPIYFPKDVDASTMMALATVTETGRPGVSENYVKAAKALSYTSVEVDKAKLTFSGLDRYTAMELRQIADDISFNGKCPPMGSNYLVNLWMDAVGTNPDKFILTITTLFPARAYASVLQYMDRR